MIGNVILITAGALLIIEGLIKFFKPNFTMMKMSMPCGGSLIILGIGLILRALGV